MKPSLDLNLVWAVRRGKLSPHIAPILRSRSTPFLFLRGFSALSCMYPLVTNSFRALNRQLHAPVNKDFDVKATSNRKEKFKGGQLQQEMA